MLANWIILTGFEVKENILINQPVSCISTLSFCRQSSRMLGNIQPEIWGARWRDEPQILTHWETSGFDMSICAFGLRPVNMMRTDSPNWAYLRFIVHKLGICHLWSAITVHAEEVEFCESNILLLHPLVLLSNAAEPFGLWFQPAECRLVLRAGRTAAALVLFWSAKA